MQRVCTKCNTLVTTDGSFCPSCGEPLPSAVDLSKNEAPRSVQFSVPAQDEHQGTMPDYGNASAGMNPTAPMQNSVSSRNDQEMTLGQWLGTILLTTWLGFASLILCIVWAVSDNVPIAKKRYCQAMLIVQAIGLVLSIIYVIIICSALYSAIPTLISILEEIGY